ncbi:MAG TPA: TIGR03435 family protein [Urbifossiella sp.]|jgi:uncharacterized protein (TIGR03435 family)
MPGHVRAGARNVTIQFIVDSFSYDSGRGRPLVDQTDPRGTFDFILESAPEVQVPAPADADFHPVQSGPTFNEAMREQLGLKFKSAKGPILVLIVNHLERPSEN